MKKLFENWRRFTERLDGPELRGSTPSSPIYPKITQFEFAEGFHGLGTSFEAGLDKDQKSQIVVLSKLFEELENAPESDPEWYGSRMPELEKGEGFASSTILNSIYTASGESEEFVFPNRQVALDFFNSIVDAKTQTQEPEKFGEPSGVADTLVAARKKGSTIVEPRRVTRKID